MASPGRSVPGLVWRPLAAVAFLAAPLAARALQLAAAAVTAEASWHRRARRLRQQARAVLAVERARRVLANHHGGGIRQPFVVDGGVEGMPGGEQGGVQGLLGNSNRGKSGAIFTNWDCHVCGLANNFGHRARCRNCEAYPKPGARRPITGMGKGGGGKGKGQWDNGGGIHRTTWVIRIPSTTTRTRCTEK